MAARQHAHTAADFVGRGKRHPDVDHVAVGQTPIGDVLMPRDEAGTASLLGPEDAAPAEDVRPDQILNDIQYFGIPNQGVQPRKQQVRVAALSTFQRLSLFRFKGFQLTSILRDFGSTQ